MRARWAPYAASGAAIVVFVVFFLITHSAWIPLIIAAPASGGVYLLMDSRTKGQVADDEYRADAARKIKEVRRELGQIVELSRRVQHRDTQQTLIQACGDIGQLLDELAEDHDSSELLTQTAKLGVYVGSVRESLRLYLPMEANPRGYPDGPRFVAEGQARFQRFAEFSLQSLHLVRRGDIATYRANLATVTPDEFQLPKLE